MNRLEQEAKKLKAVAHVHKLGAWDLLTKRKKGMFQGQLADKLGIHPTLLSHHLREMWETGWVTRKEEGKNVRYFAVPSKLSIIK